MWSIDAGQFHFYDLGSQQKEFMSPSIIKMSVTNSFYIQNIQISYCCAPMSGLKKWNKYLSHIKSVTATTSTKNITIYKCLLISQNASLIKMWIILLHTHKYSYPGLNSELAVQKIHQTKRLELWMQGCDVSSPNSNNIKSSKGKS